MPDKAPDGFVYRWFAVICLGLCVMGLFAIKGGEQGEGIRGFVSACFQLALWGWGLGTIVKAIGSGRG